MYDDFTSPPPRAHTPLRLHCSMSLVMPTHHNPAPSSIPSLVLEEPSCIPASVLAPEKHAQTQGTARASPQESEHADARAMPEITSQYFGIHEDRCSGSMMGTDQCHNSTGSSTKTAGASLQWEKGHQTQQHLTISTPQASTMGQLALHTATSDSQSCTASSR